MQKQQKMKNPRNPHGYEDFLGGDCWTRTSDLLRVKPVVAVATKRWYKRDCGLFSSAWCHAGATQTIKNKAADNKKVARGQLLSCYFPFTS